MVRKRKNESRRVPSLDNVHVSDGYTKSLDYGDWNNVGMKSKGYGPIYPYENKGKM